MSIDTVTDLVKQIKKLSPTDKEKVRSALGPVFPHVRPKATEEDFRKVLVAAGLLTAPAANTRAKATRRRPFTPVPVRGKPVSETLIAERR